MAVEVKARAGSSSGSPLEQSLLLPGQWEQMKAIENARHFLVPVGTHWVENDVLRISETVARRHPNLRVVSCTCGNDCVKLGHYPHMVVEFTRTGQTLPVFGFTEFSEEVIARLDAIHVSQNPNEAAMKHNEQQRKKLQAASDDARREGLEIVEQALKSPKFDWRGPNGLRTKAF